MVCKVLNQGVLPAGYYALPERQALGLKPDILALTLPSNGYSNGTQPYGKPTSGGVALAEPRLKPVVETDTSFYARNADSIAIRRADGSELIAVIEIVSPGNKDSQSRLDDFVHKIIGFLEAGVHVLLIDILPPSRLARAFIRTCGIE